eukprot:370011-Rhodomonas_salina.1
MPKRCVLARAMRPLSPKRCVLVRAMRPLMPKRGGYAVCGTEIAYAACGAMQTRCPVRTHCTTLAAYDVSSTELPYHTTLAAYAVSGTDIPHCVPEPDSIPPQTDHGWDRTLHPHVLWLLAYPRSVPYCALTMLLGYAPTAASCIQYQLAFCQY